MPKAPWILTKQEEGAIKQVIASIRTPTGYMHSLKGAFTHDGKIIGLKSHDWHKLLQYILPISLKGCLTEPIRHCLYRLSAFVR